MRESQIDSACVLMEKRYKPFRTRKNDSYIDSQTMR